MKTLILLTTMVLSACSTSTPKQTEPPAQVAPALQEQAGPGADAAPAGSGLSDLAAVTFGCPKAGLNAAAREAAKAPAQGSYQFAYFRIVNDSHHSTYEVHFKSNYFGEPDLKYCVSVYCQQGWDPKTSKTTVRLMGNGPKPAAAATAGAAHLADCGDQQTPVKRRAKHR